jgi:hypothetical protein
LRGKGTNRRGAENAEEEEERIKLEIGLPCKVRLTEY